MNWQCPRCETFNRTAEAHCGVCDLAKPKRMRTTKTATKTKDLLPIELPKKTSGGGRTLSFELIDRRSSTLSKSAESGKTITPATSEPPTSSTPTDAKPGATPGAAIVNLLGWLAVIVFNIYIINDLWFVQKLSLAWFIIGMIYTNLIGLVILGGIIEFIKWLISPADSAK